MITIQQILASDSFETMIFKINQSFSQLATLNGGPQGKSGKQGIPGLPGLQGKQGLTGAAGENGSRVFLFVGNPNDPNIDFSYNANPLLLPEETELLVYIQNSIYQEGDVFITNKHPYPYNSQYSSTKNVFYKIIKDINGVYGYSTYNLYQTIGNYDPLWFKSVYTIPGSPTHEIVGIFNRTDTLNSTMFTPSDLQMTENDNRKSFLLNTFVTSFANDELQIDTIQNAIHNSISYPTKRILAWDRTAFKLSVDQRYPFDEPFILQQDFNKLTETGVYAQSMLTDMPHQYLNFWNNIHNDINLNGQNEIYFDEFNILSTTSPILYLQPFTTNSPNFTNHHDEFYTDFGIFIKRIYSPDVFGNSNPYKSVLIFASDDNNENDIYFKSKNIWSESNFISEINKNNYNLNLTANNTHDRFYTSFITKELSDVDTLYLNNKLRIAYGHSSYSTTNQFQIDTGMECITNPVANSHINSLYKGQYGSLNTYLTETYVNNASSIITNKYIVCRIDEYGAFKFNYRLTNNTIEEENFLNVENSRFTIYEQDSNNSGYDIMKLIGRQFGSNNCLFRIENPTQLTGDDNNDIIASLTGARNTDGDKYETNIGYKLKRTFNNNTVDTLSIISKANTNGNEKIWNHIKSQGKLLITADYDNSILNISGNVAAYDYSDIIFQLTDVANNTTSAVAGIKRKISNDTNLIIPGSEYFWASKNQTSIEALNVIPDSTNVAAFIQSDRPGTLQIKDTTQGVGKVFTSDANGIGQWAEPLYTGRYIVWDMLNNNPPPEGTFDNINNIWLVPTDVKMVIINNPIQMSLHLAQSFDGHEIEFLINGISTNQVSAAYKIQIKDVNLVDILKITNLDLAFLSEGEDTLNYTPHHSIYFKVKYFNNNFNKVLKLSSAESGSGYTQELIFGQPINIALT